jgi:hypothetical protein
MMTKKKGVSGQFNADLYKVEGLSPLKVSDYVQFKDGTPGNVGICLSGGGSRAMTAGMGQLLGLMNLQKNNKNLLAQTKAVSTVSGGSWLGVTFEYLNDSDVSDQDFLGTYKTPGSLTKEDLDELSNKTIAFRCTSDFSLLYLLLEAVWIGIFDEISTHMLWQTLMGIHILEFYNLFTSRSSHQPDSFFTYGTTARQAIVDDNPSLKDETYHLIASGADRVHRPWQVCNMGMFVNTPGTDFQFLVPVQATPFFTGIVSTPADAKDFSGRLVGGGGVTSFAFNSDLNSVGGGGNSSEVEVEQDRQWTIVDIVGTSSAAFSETLQNLAASFVDDPKKLFDEAKANSINPLDSLKKVKPFIQKKKPGLFEKILEDIEQFKFTKEIESDIDTLESFFKKKGLDLEKELGPILEDISRFLNPLYKYWPVLNAAPEADVTATNFADGGSLENTGINAMLTYSDIDNLISFVNTSTALEGVVYSIFDVNGKPVPDTNIMIDGQVTSLFGYQPYNDGKKKKTQLGYWTYKDKNGNFREDPLNPEFRNNQVFPSEKFAEMLTCIWQAAGSGKNQGAANYLQSLTTIENKWFGVAGNRSIKVLWVYNNFIGDWFDNLKPEVKKVVEDIKDFPGYSVFNTELSKTQINLLANMTAWNLIEGSPNLFLSLYQDE